MDKKYIQDRIRGSLIGGAAGDALGYPVEFMDIRIIRYRYGMGGITRYDTRQCQGEDVAEISDDTHMTMFTACGLLNSTKTGGGMLSSIRRAYIEWYFTQTGVMNKEANDCWIMQLPELYSLRAPGNTCMTSLSRISEGYEAVNFSKGCGGIMRIAPIALYGAAGCRMDIRDTCRLAAGASKLTHQHPLGYIPSALVAHIIYRLANDANPTREACIEYVKEGLEMISEMYSELPGYVEEFSKLILRAINVSASSTEDIIVIENSLGEGWTAEETAAIAIYCALKYFGDFEGALRASVNHHGDSDSTGAVTGNVLGAALGYEAIPQFYKNKLELHDVILHIADDLYRGEETPYRK